MLKTQAWLEKFCEQNQARVFPDAVPLVHIFNPKESLLRLAVSLEDVAVEAEEVNQRVRGGPTNGELDGTWPWWVTLETSHDSPGFTYL